MRIPYWLIILVAVGYMIASYSEFKTGLVAIQRDLNLTIAQIMRGLDQ